VSKYRPQNKESTASDYQLHGGIGPQEREVMLVDDLRHEISRLADAIERQNELLVDDEQEPEQ
jgi:hypothetical protein